MMRFPDPPLVLCRGTGARLMGTSGSGGGGGSRATGLSKWSKESTSCRLESGCGGLAWWRKGRKEKREFSSVKKGMKKS